LQSSGLQAKYSKDSVFYLQVCILAALNFVPIYNVVKSLGEILDSGYYQTNQDI
jgi:hypothetical protein